MDRLRACFDAMGLDNVETFIASGNVVFESPITTPRTLELQIQNELRAALGYEVASFVRTPSEVTAAARFQAFQKLVEPLALWVGFLPDAPSAAQRRALASRRTDTDDFHTHGKEFYWHRRSRESDSRLTGKQLERAIGMPFTLRNVTTLRRLSAKYANEA